MDYNQLVQDVLDGNESALKALALLKELEKDVKKCISEIEEVAFNEASMYEEKSFIFSGFQFEKRSGGRTFDYSSIKKWKDAKNTLKEIEVEAKQAYSCYENKMLVANGDGEEIQLPKVKYKKDSIIVKRIK